MNYLIVKGNKVIKQLERKNKLTSKQKTHMLYRLNQKYPEAEISIARIEMSVYTPFYNSERPT